MFDFIDCNKAAFEITQADGPRYENEMLAFLGLKNMSGPKALPPNGTYRNNTLHYEITVNGLTVKDPNGKIRNQYL